MHVPSLSVGLTYTKGSWWIVTIWGRGDTRPGPPALGCPGRCPLLSTQTSLEPPPQIPDISRTTPYGPLWQRSACCSQEGRQNLRLPPVRRGRLASWNTVPSLGHFSFRSWPTEQSLGQWSLPDVQSALSPFSDFLRLRTSLYQPKAYPLPPPPAMKTGACPLRACPGLGTCKDCPCSLFQLLLASASTRRGSLSDHLSCLPASPPVRLPSLLWPLQTRGSLGLTVGTLSSLSFRALEAGSRQDRHRQRS